MNLILLSPADFIANTNRVCLTDRRLQHVLEILKPALNDTLTVGMIAPEDAEARIAQLLKPGLMGSGRVVKLSREALELEVTLDTPPPPKLPVVLCLALMRPIVLKRVLQTVAAMGVAEIHIFHSHQVEKSFWQSTALHEEEIRHELVLGLEQARDTVLPKVSFHKRFKPFVEDVLPRLLEAPGKGAGLGIVADPSGGACRIRCGASSVSRPKSYILIIGPEGGFIPYEIGKFQEAGYQIINLGQRILRVENAVVVLLARFSYGS